MDGAIIPVMTEEDKLLATNANLLIKNGVSVLRLHGITFSSGSTSVTIPLGYTPKYTMIAMGVGYVGTTPKTIYIQVQNTGALACYSIDGGSEVAFSGLVYGEITWTL